MSDIKIGSEWVDKETGLEFTVIKSKGFDVEIDLGCGRKGSYAPKTFLNCFMPKEQGRKDDSAKPKAVELLETSAATLIRCGKKYDSTGNNSERVMDRIVDMFNAATGHKLSEAQGNIFMVCLKVVRSETSAYHDDDHYIDGVNYFAMAGEAASEANND
ncbi:DUF6378 domain-containing protein [Psychrobacter immobilis]|uniref:DUF6378 domain-containing protein n=1 Tax=Psychrobacter immobilis TaxID=498 RepID=UPI003FD18B05